MLLQCIHCYIVDGAITTSTYETEVTSNSK